MKKYMLFVMAITAAAVFSGCSSIDPKAVNWNLPKGADLSSRNMRQTIRVQLYPLDIHSADMDAESAAIIRREFSEMILNRYIHSKRFVVTDSEKHEYQSDIIVTPTLKFGGPRSIKGGYRINMAIINLDTKMRDRSGEYQEAESYTATSHPNVNRATKTRIILGREEVLSKADRMTLAISCIHDAFKKLEKGLNDLYPVSAAIKNCRISGNKVSFVISKGTNHGVDSEDDALICLEDEKGIVTVVALANGTVGKYTSTLNVVCWNPFEVEAENVRQGLASGKKFKMYAVFRKKVSK